MPSRRVNIMSDTAVTAPESALGSVDRGDVHFDLSFLGDDHLTKPYTLRWGRTAYVLRRHSPETLREAGFGEGPDRPTHVAAQVQRDAKVVGLMRVYGPTEANGFATLAALAVSTGAAKPPHSVADVAQAIVFMDPTVSVLTPAAADRVLGHI